MSTETTYSPQRGQPPEYQYTISAALLNYYACTCNSKDDTESVLGIEISTPLVLVLTNALD